VFTLPPNIHLFRFSFRTELNITPTHLYGYFFNQNFTPYGLLDVLFNDELTSTYFGYFHPGQKRVYDCDLDFNEDIVYNLGIYLKDENSPTLTLSNDTIKLFTYERHYNYDAMVERKATNSGISSGTYTPGQLTYMKPKEKRILLSRMLNDISKMASSQQIFVVVWACRAVDEEKYVAATAYAETIPMLYYRTHYTGNKLITSRYGPSVQKLVGLIAPSIIANTDTDVYILNGSMYTSEKISRKSNKIAYFVQFKEKDIIDARLLHRICLVNIFIKEKLTISSASKSTRVYILYRTSKQMPHLIEAANYKVIDPFEQEIIDFYKSALTISNKGKWYITKRT
jgi:hypothetical protein